MFGRNSTVMHHTTFLVSCTMYHVIPTVNFWHYHSLDGIFIVRMETDISICIILDAYMHSLIFSWLCRVVVGRFLRSLTERDRIARAHTESGIFPLSLSYVLELFLTLRSP